MCNQLHVFQRRYYRLELMGILLVACGQIKPLVFIVLSRTITFSTGFLCSMFSFKFQKGHCTGILTTRISTLTGEQMVNHFPNCQLLTNKMGLLNSLQSYEQKCIERKGKPPNMKLIDFFPETYRLDDLSDRESFFRSFKGEYISSYYNLWYCIQPV